MLFEYGESVLESKKLINELNIEENIIWLPKMSRKEIMFLLSSVDIGVGEFYNIEKRYGEVLDGKYWHLGKKPLLQSFRFNKGEFENTVGYPEPDLLNVLKRRRCILSFIKLFKDRNRYVEIGKKITYLV